MADGLSNREAGKIAGVSHVAIAKARRSGRLKVQANGLIAPADLEVWRIGRSSGRPGNPVTPPVTGTAAAVAGVLDDTGDDISPDELAAALTAQGIFLTRAAAELHRDSYVARMKQLQFEEEAGKVVEVESVAKIVGESLARVRTRLLAIPAEQAPRLHRIKTVGELQDAILECITEALEELVTEAAFEPGD